MVNPEHLEILGQGVEVWNKWRKENPNIRPDLSQADLRDMDLRNVDLSQAHLPLANLTGLDLSGATFIMANLNGAFLSGVDLRGVDLRKARFIHAYLTEADLSGANLRGAILIDANLWRAILVGADLYETDLSGAALREAHLAGTKLLKTKLRAAYLVETDLSGARLEDVDLSNASLVRTDLRGATILGCSVYGVGAWDLKTDDKTEQESLVITPEEEQKITVDDLEIAQFLYLVLNNEKLGHFIRVMRTSAVLILGSFGPDSKEFREALRANLRAKGFAPIVFDFDTSKTSYKMETVQTLALLSNFVIVDLSEPAGEYAEIERLIPTTYVPFIKIAREGAHVSGMLEYPHDWVIDDCIKYPKALEEAKKSIPNLIENQVIPLAEEINRRLHPES